ncbi:hypothetical protein JCM10213_005263 [Rhodosporidiobolus nylandii]
MKSWRDVRDVVRSALHGRKSVKERARTVEEISRPRPDAPPLLLPLELVLDILDLAVSACGDNDTASAALLRAFSGVNRTLYQVYGLKRRSRIARVATIYHKHWLMQEVLVNEAFARSLEGVRLLRSDDDKYHLSLVDVRWLRKKCPGLTLLELHCNCGNRGGKCVPAKGYRKGFLTVREVHGRAIRCRTSPRECSTIRHFSGVHIRPEQLFFDRQWPSRDWSSNITTLSLTLSPFFFSSFYADPNNPLVRLLSACAPTLIALRLLVPSHWTLTLPDSVVFPNLRICSLPYTALPPSLPFFPSLQHLLLTRPHCFVGRDLECFADHLSTALITLASAADDGQLPLLRRVEVPLPPTDGSEAPLVLWDEEAQLIRRGVEVKQAGAPWEAGVEERRFTRLMREVMGAEAPPY